MGSFSQMKLYEKDTFTVKMVYTKGLRGWAIVYPAPLLTSSNSIFSMSVSSSESSCLGKQKILC